MLPLCWCVGVDLVGLGVLFSLPSLVVFIVLLTLFRLGQTVDVAHGQALLVCDTFQGAVDAAVWIVPCSTDALDAFLRQVALPTPTLKVLVALGSAATFTTILELNLTLPLVNRHAKVSL